MKTKVCPCCDQPITGIYCKGCRKLVLKPAEHEIRYYLNTRHPDNEHDCTFHGDLNAGKIRRSTSLPNVRRGDNKMTTSEAERKKAEIRARMENRKAEQKASANRRRESFWNEDQAGSLLEMMRSRNESKASKTAAKGIGNRIDRHPARRKIILLLTLLMGVLMMLFMSIMTMVFNSLTGISPTTMFTSQEVVKVSPEPIRMEVPSVEIVNFPQVTLSPEMESLFQNVEAVPESNLPTP